MKSLIAQLKEWLAKKLDQKPNPVEVEQAKRAERWRDR